MFHNNEIENFCPNFFSLEIFCVILVNLNQLTDPNKKLHFCVGLAWVISQSVDFLEKKIFLPDYWKSLSSENYHFIY